MTVWLPQFQKIKDFWTLETQLQLNFSKKLGKENKDQNSIETSDNDEIIQKSSRSLKQKIKDPQLTFEKEFMKEHFQAFNFCIQNYIEQMFVGRCIGRANLTNSEIFPKKSIFTNRQQQLQYYLKGSSSLLDVKKAEMFMEDLLHEEKLCEFLSYMCQNSCDEVALELVWITNQIWQTSLTIQSLQDRYQKIIEVSKNLVENIWQKIKKMHGIKYFTFENTLIRPTIQLSKKQRCEKKMIEFLVVTILLNPYYHQKVRIQLERHVFLNNYSIYQSYEDFSDIQESEEFIISKRGKRKFL